MTESEVESKAESKKSRVIAIDGPSGSGKSTIAKLVAQKLDLVYLDTGAMFRAIAYFLDQGQVSADDDELVQNKLEEFNFIYAKDENCLVEVDGVDLTEKIREHHVSKLASIYSQNSIVRNYLKKLQQKIASVRPSILEGRDIGTVVFPNAAVKFFLTANNEVRAQRRYSQIKEKDPDSSLTVESIMADIIKRDEEDSNREIAPLVKAQDAIEIDTSSLSVDEIIEIICEKFGLNQQHFS